MIITVQAMSVAQFASNLHPLHPLHPLLRPMQPILQAMLLQLQTLMLKLTATYTPLEFSQIVSMNGAIKMALLTRNIPNVIRLQTMDGLASNPK